MNNDTELSRTSIDALEGTPLYTPPEAVTSPIEVDGRSDIYSLGAVGYYLLCGKPPFNGGTSVEVLTKHLHDQPLNPSVRLDRSLPNDLEAVIIRCLAKKPEDRPQSARDLWNALRSCKDASAWNVYEAEQWWREKRELIEQTREAARRQVPRDGALPPTPTVAVQRRTIEKMRS